MEHKKKLIHVTTMPIRWGDMDAYGHVNNTVYFRYMEQARVEWIEDMKVQVRPGGDGPVIINASCTFLIPMNYPGTRFTTRERMLLKLLPVQFLGHGGEPSPDPYIRLLQVADFVAGMTDSYAVDMFRKLKGFDLPT